MILQFNDHNYLDVDKIQALRWMREQNAGVVVLDGEKIVVQAREDFDVIETAYIYKNKTVMYDDRMKKMRFTRRELTEGE